jgi:serine/threonine protein kinase
MLINGRYKKVGRIGEGSYGDVYKCVDYYPGSEPRRLPEKTIELIKAVQNGDIATDSDDFENNFHDQFTENEKFMNLEAKQAPEEGSEHFIAIKKTKMRSTDYLKHSFNFSTYKEIFHLQELKHENIVKLIDMFFKDKSIYVVLEYMVGDLYQLIHKDKITLNPSQVK